MSDQVAPAAEPVEATPSATPDVEATPVVGNQVFSDPDNYTFQPDFANHLGEDLNPSAHDLNQRFGGQSMHQLARSYVEANKLISQGGRAVGYPAADAPEGDVSKWREANGIHADFTAADYHLKPQDAEGLPDEVFDAFSEKMLGRNVPPALAQGLAQDYLEIEAEFARRAEDTYKNEMHAEQRKLQSEWGPEYEDRLNKIKAVVSSEGFDPGDATLFDNPKVIRLLGKFVNRLGEDTVASALASAQATGKFSGGGKYEAERIMTDPSHPDYDRYRQGDEAVASKVTRLLQGG